MSSPLQIVGDDSPPQAKLRVVGQGNGLCLGLKLEDAENLGGKGYAGYERVSEG